MIWELIPKIPEPPVAAGAGAAIAQQIHRCRAAMAGFVLMDKDG